jgi:pyruvate/2-oxoglutarate dehydrogenase complex dihydrolipoamide acyltransferase (E2) component
MMRVCVVFALGLIWAWTGQAQGKWGMVDTNGAARIAPRYDEIGSFRGDLAKGLPLPEFLPGIKGAKIVKWLKAEGQEVKKDEPLAQVELKEPSLPVPAPVNGMLTKIEVPAGGAAIPGASLGQVRVLGKVDLFAEKQFDVKCPSFGPNSGSATVVRWLKMEGEPVVKGQTIAEIRPLEAMAAVLSPGTGTLVKLEIPEGAEAATGQSIARMGIGRVPVRQGRDWFFVDERGNRVTGTRFDEVGVVQGGMAPVRQGNRWGFVDGEGNLIEKADYDAAREVWGGLAAVRLQERWGFVAYHEGRLKNAIPPRFLKARDFAEGLAAVEESDDAPVGEEGEALVFEDKPEKKPAGPAAWGYIIPSGKLWIPLQFAEVGDFLDGRAAVRPEGEGAFWALIDSRGKVRTTGPYRGLAPLGEKRVAWKKEEGWGLMDFSEKVMEISPGAEKQDVLTAIGPFGSERAPAKDRQGKWGYVDPGGRWAIPAKFERAGVFRNGLAAAKEPGKKWGFLKPDGSWGIEPKFSRVRSFSDGLAAVFEEGEVEPGPEPETGGVWP